MTPNQFRYMKHLYWIHAAVAAETGEYGAEIDIRRERRGTPGGTPVARYRLPEAFDTEAQAMAAGNRAAKRWIEVNSAA